MGRTKKGHKVDLDKLARETLAVARTGRSLKSFGTSLQHREQNNAKLIRDALNEGLPYSKTNLALVISEPDVIEERKYSTEEALQWFSEVYPNEYLQLKNRLEEKREVNVTEISYGLRGERDIPSLIYAKALSETLKMSPDSAMIVYNTLIKPHLDKQDAKGKKDLISIVLKDN